jgi:hypothetical protein
MYVWPTAHVMYRRRWCKTEVKEWKAVGSSSRCKCYEIHRIEHCTEAFDVTTWFIILIYVVFLIKRAFWPNLGKCHVREDTPLCEPWIGNDSEENICAWNSIRMEQLHLLAFLNIVRTIRSKRLITHAGDTICINVLDRKPDRTTLARRIILKWILGK